MIILFIAPARRLNYLFLMTENEITDRVLDCCFEIHKNIGPGLFDLVYEEILAFEMTANQLNYER